MTKGEIIQFGGDGEVQGFMRKPTSPPSHRSAAGEPEFFVPLGEPVLAVVMRLQGRLPRVRLRATAEGEKPSPS